MPYANERCQKQPVRPGGQKVCRDCQTSLRSDVAKSAAGHDAICRTACCKCQVFQLGVCSSGYRYTVALPLCIDLVHQKQNSEMNLFSHLRMPGPYLYRSCFVQRHLSSAHPAECLDPRHVYNSRSAGDYRTTIVAGSKMQCQACQSTHSCKLCAPAFFHVHKSLSFQDSVHLLSNADDYQIKIWHLSVGFDVSRI